MCTNSFFTMCLEKSRLRITTRVLLISAFVFIALVPASIINIIYYGKEREYILQRLEQYNLQMLSKAGEQLNFILAQVETVNYELLSMANEYDIFSINYKKHTSQTLEKMRLYEGVMQSIRRTVPVLSDVYFIDFDGYLYSSVWACDKEKLLQKDWIRHYKPNNQWTVIPAHAADYYDRSSKRHEQVISFVKPVGEWMNSSRLEGIIQIDIRYEHIRHLVESAATDGKGHIYLVDDKGRTLYCEDGELSFAKQAEIIANTPLSEDGNDPGTITRDGENMIISKCLPGMNWYIIAMIPVREPLLEIEKAKEIVLGITVLAAGFSLLMGWGLSAAITKPLRKLMRKMNRVKVDEIKFEPIEFVTLNHDMKVLSDSYNIMLQKIDLLMRNIVKQEQDKRNVELQMLQAQISPHFLYNTLNTVKWMALMENQPRIADAIVSLVDLLEFCCKKRDGIIPVSEELKVLNDYIHIQQLRYSRQIRIRFEIDPEVYDLYILKFTLQPSVENAIIHAFTEKKEDAVISIRGKASDDQVIYEVEDNGVGMDDYTLKHMTGLGVSNVNERIKLHFGDRYGQTIRSEYGKGTLVIITLPRITASEDVRGASSVQAPDC